MNLDLHEKHANEILRAELKIEKDWTVQTVNGLWQVESPSDLAQAISEDFADNLEDEETIREIIDHHCKAIGTPEKGRIFLYTSPNKHFRMLATASPRDLLTGTQAFLDRLDLDQLRFARDAVDERINAKIEEEKRTVWRVCDRVMCRGNFREENYLGAVAFMAEEAIRLNSEAGSKRPRELELRLVAERVVDSEYEEYFE